MSALNEVFEQYVFFLSTAPAESQKFCTQGDQVASYEDTASDCPLPAGKYKVEGDQLVPVTE